MDQATCAQDAPPTNTPVDQTRRHLLTIAASGIIAALAMPSTVAASAADPIFAAIDAHRDCRDVVDHLLAGLDGPDWRPMYAALVAEVAAAKALIETAPTTRAGLRALECYLREDRNSNARMRIRMTGTMDGRTYTWSSSGPEGVNWLIAKRAAEIAAEG